MKASAVVPAYNEALRIVPVLAAIAGAASVSEIIVVDDGSQDGTADAAERAGATVIRLPENGGKARAMCEGAKRAANDIVVFLDADLVGLTPGHVDDLVRPVLAGEVDMTVGQFWSGSPLVTAWMRFCPAISGQRAMHAADFLAIAGVATSGYGVEVTITRHAISRGLGIRYVHLPNISHVWKESKRGLLRGLGMRAMMYGQIVRATVSFRYHRMREVVRHLGH